MDLLKYPTMHSSEDNLENLDKVLSVKCDRCKKGAFPKILKAVMNFEFEWAINQFSALQPRIHCHFLLHHTRGRGNHPVEPEGFGGLWGVVGQGGALVPPPLFWWKQ